MFDQVSVLPYPITLPKAAKGLLAALACAGLPFTTAASGARKLTVFGNSPVIRVLNAIVGRPFASSGTPRSA
jgi:prepilin signal peptidase PulO-like enzyme (type II secretory pathway)